MSDGISAKTTGIEAIDRRLKELAGKEARKVVRSGVGAGLTVLANAVRSQTRSTNMSPEMRAELLKTIGKRFAKDKAGEDKGQLKAKAGFTVSKKMKKSGKARPKGKGVGISANNAHWALLGTTDRLTGGKSKRTKTGGRVRVLNGKPIRPRGKMPRLPPVARLAAASSLDQVYKTIDRASRQKLEEVVASLRNR